MTFATTVEARLRDVRAPDPRVAWLPDHPAAAEAHLRTDGSCDLVVGYDGTRFGELDAFVGRCAGDHRATWTRWVAAIGRHVLDAGAQLGADPQRLQVYLRGHYDPATAAAAFGAIDVAIEPQLIANALALFSLRTAEMIGLELASARAGAAIYLAVPSRGTADAPRLTSAIALLLAAMRPAGANVERWRAVAADLLGTVSEEHVYISFAPTAALPWIKIDVGPRPLALAGMIATRLGLDANPMLTLAVEHRMTALTHVGLRFGGDSVAPSIYHSLV